MTDRPAAPSRKKHLERLLEISRTLAATSELPPLLVAIVDVACELTQSAVASILLYDPETSRLRFEAVPGFQQKDLIDVSVPLDSSVAGWIYTNGRPMVIQDTHNDSRVYRPIDKALGFETLSILSVPLIVRGKPIGVLEALNKQGEGNYTEDDLEVLETLAAQAAVAIDNARLLVNIQDTNTELQRLDHMKSDFIAIASHELRTPLGLILGHATFLKEYVPPKHQEQMEIIIRSAMRLKAIIEDLATIAHPEQGESRVRREPFSVSKLVEEVAGRFGGMAAEKKLEIGFDVPDGDPLIVDGDQEKLEIALSNIVKNAIIFTDPGGQVGIKAEGNHGMVKIFVVDTGIGIPPEAIDQVFDRFFQVESHLTRKHGGMGLGLSIAKAMVEMHNGQIWCESKEATGSLFCMMLPTDRAGAQAASKVFRSV
ncbi:MAG: ATP-binding protein [Anaerolineales bacterium]|nr:ATP-binding protein [Anaerolineales bacterium]